MADLEKRNAVVLASLVTMSLLCTYSAMTAEVSDVEHTHQLAWFILSVPAAIYLIQALIRSGELIAVRRGSRRLTG